MESLTFEQWQRAVQPKVSSTLYFDQYLPNLSFFVMLSSVTGVLGHVSQSNYTAGGAFQDAFARHRTASGRPTVSFDLSAVTSAGYVAENLDNRARTRLESLGTVSLDVGVILQHIGIALQRPPQHSNPDDAQVIFGLAPWDQLPEHSVVRKDRRFGTLRLAISRGSTAASPSETTVEAGNTNPSILLARAVESSERSPHSIAGALAARLAVIFSVVVEAIDLSVGMTAHGVDSLVAVDLRNWISGAAKAKVSIFEILQSKSLLEFAALISERSPLAR